MIDLPYSLFYCKNCQQDSTMATYIRTDQTYVGCKKCGTHVYKATRNKVSELTHQHSQINYGRTK